MVSKHSTIQPVFLIILGCWEEVTDATIFCIQNQAVSKDTEGRGKRKDYNPDEAATKGPHRVRDMMEAKFMHESTP